MLYIIISYVRFNVNEYVRYTIYTIFPPIYVRYFVGYSGIATFLYVRYSISIANNNTPNKKEIKAMTKNIIDLIEASGAEYIGIRHLADDEHYNVGDYCRNSYDWNYEFDCSTYETEEPQELPGTCAYNTRIHSGWDDSEEIKSKLEKALNASKVYYGDIVIIGGDRVTYGNDEGEIIIEDAVVIATI